jgi:hypothetical protein
VPQSDKTLIVSGLLLVTCAGLPVDCPAVSALQEAIDNVRYDTYRKVRNHSVPMFVVVASDMVLWILRASVFPVARVHCLVLST